MKSALNLKTLEIRKKKHTTSNVKIAAILRTFVMLKRKFSKRILLQKTSIVIRISARAKNMVHCRNWTSKKPTRVT